MHILLFSLFPAMALFVRSAFDTYGNERDSSEPEPEEPVQEKPSRARRIARIVGLVLVTILLGVAALMLLEEGLVYNPEPEPLRGTWEPRDLPVEHVTFRTEDGLQLHGWWREADEAADTQPVVIYCHGGGGNMTVPADRIELANILAEAGLNILMFDYRGYGASEGSPDEEGLYRDSEAAYDFVVSEMGVEPCRVFAYGRFLGAGVALNLALERDVQGVVLDGAFASIPRMAELHPLLKPLTFLIRNQFDSVEKARQIDVPLMIIHGSDDEIVPVSHARDIRQAAADRVPANIWVVRGATHADTFFVGRSMYGPRVSRFCRQHMDCED